MGILTSQKIATYYELFKGIDVTFSKEIIQVTGLITNQVYMKCVGDFWPCVIFSTSFQGAKSIVNTKTGILRKLERANNMVSLRFCFKIADKANPVTFFVNSKVSGHTPYAGSEDVALFNLQFTQRPPDALIEIMGRILDANVNSAKRREYRIPITAESTRKLGINKESSVFIQGVPRHCILRDLSFSGVKIIMMGVAKFLVDREAVLKVEFDDPRETFLLKGKFIRSEAVEGRKELVSLVIHFEESIVPMSYKIRINDYLTHARPENRGAGRETGGDLPLPPSAEKPDAEAAALDKKPASSPSGEKDGGAEDAETAADSKPRTESKAGSQASAGDESFNLNLPSA